MTTFNLLLSLSLYLSGVSQALCAAWPHSVYVWQRVHSDELLNTLIEEHSLFDEVRVLVAQSEKNGQWAPMNPRWNSWQTLDATLIPVFRLQGSQPPLDSEILLQQILTVRREWQQEGLAFARVEIDFDCAESQLARYHVQLDELKQQLETHQIALDITALPAWLDHAEFRAILQTVDRVTLQVHAVATPHAGLFDTKQAEHWIRQLDALANKPYSVALPAYGASLLLGDDNKVLGVEHEAQLAVQSNQRVEVEADPLAVQTLLKTLATSPPRHLQQLAWFRLPLPGDERSWRLVTLKAVMQEQPLLARTELHQLRNTAGGYDVVIKNIGNLAAPLPSHIEIPTGCRGEGVGGYSTNQTGFTTASKASLKPGAASVVGWLRCQQPLADSEYRKAL